MVVNAFKHFKVYGDQIFKFKFRIPTEEDKIKRKLPILPEVYLK